ncbi:MAG: twitching motility protein PilT [Verrucomicrobia bacterium]|nr:twitching motility protein PilT [Verrucomicrobiota bacterium]
MDRTLLFFRSLFLTGCGVAGWYVSGVSKAWMSEPWLGSFLGLALGLFVILIDSMIKGVSLRAFSSATFGLILGCVLATLIWASRLFDYASEDARWVIHLLVYLTFGYLGTMLALRSNRDEFSLIIPYVRFMRQEPHEQVTLLDTSAIIDGRIADLCKSGFLEGTLVVPRFVLQELQNLADSGDAGRRMRGRHGLDLLNELQTNPSIEIKIHETGDSSENVDARMVHLARVLNARIATTDYNMGRVAELQKVRVLNIHLLAGILRQPLMAGEALRLKLVREGKEPHQAVGFLPDGTMIVVNQARNLIGQEADIVVSGSIQTVAGRMVFADLAHATSRGDHHTDAR